MNLFDFSTARANHLAHHSGWHLIHSGVASRDGPSGRPVLHLIWNSDSSRALHTLSGAPRSDAADQNQR